MLIKSNTWLHWCNLLIGFRGVGFIDLLGFGDDTSFNALEGHDYIFPGPLFESSKINKRRLNVVAVTLLFALADEPCVIVSLLQTSPGECRSRETRNVPGEEISKAESTGGVAKVEPNLCV